MEYHKIHSIFKRDENKPRKLIQGQWSLPEFEYLQNNEWTFTEKVDGTNIRIIFENEKLRFGGRTENALIPAKLVEKLNGLFTVDKLIPIFPEGVILYGEGYGSGIQCGGLYKEYQDFVLFDIKIGHFWLKRQDVENCATKLNIESVPIIGTGTLHDAIKTVKDGLISKWGNFKAEGIVARPSVELKSRAGNRIIAKIKTKDF